MHATLIIKILGLLLMLFSALGNLPPLLVSTIYSDGMSSTFINSFIRAIFNEIISVIVVQVKLKKSHIRMKLFRH